MLQWHPGAVAEGDGRPGLAMPWKPPSNLSVGPRTVIDGGRCYSYFIMG